MAGFAVREESVVSQQSAMPVVVAIDGPSGSGKSSVARAVAASEGYAFLDTGAMYRALTWYCLHQGIDLSDANGVAAAAIDFPLSQALDPNETWVAVGQDDVTDAIRSQEVSVAVSAVAAHMPVRAELIRRQRAIIAEAQPGIVAEGRDITTVVAPNAQVRILLTASEEVRLARRGLQLNQAGTTQSEAHLRAQVIERDAKDSAVTSFTTASDGVVTVDSSELDFAHTVQAVVAILHQRLANDAEQKLHEEMHQ